jgi:hypothetical protein
MHTGFPGKAQIMSVQMFSVSERRLQQQKALPAGIAAAAQVQCVLHTTDAVKDHEQAVLKEEQMR